MRKEFREPSVRRVLSELKGFKVSLEHKVRLDLQDLLERRVLWELKVPRVL